MDYLVRRPPSLSIVTRLLLAVFGVMGICLCLLAYNLQADPRGFGTHEQLGLTPCKFYQWTGCVCPSCGATTAWVHALHGNLGEAVSANLAGTLLCIATLVAVPWLFLVAALGRWFAWSPSGWALLGMGSGLLAIALLDWLRRVCT